MEGGEKNRTLHGQEGRGSVRKEWYSTRVLRNRSAQLKISSELFAFFFTPGHLQQPVVKVTKYMGDFLYFLWDRCTECSKFFFSLTLFSFSFSGSVPFLPPAAHTGN
ncbi:hypothetical protein CDAR_261151 [Caerostris darwini]|uniref:Uncharacterized protein n=1 Tax=Caerostris darwini TaxID=1538125 RepID=A0AAV4UIF5_9ARAC|nr:hypothetical protein CDAR_261151 [Caerostris darwini]